MPCSMSTQGVTWARSICTVWHVLGFNRAIISGCFHQFWRCDERLASAPVTNFMLQRLWPRLWVNDSACLLATCTRPHDQGDSSKLTSAVRRQ